MPTPFVQAVVPDAQETDEARLALSQLAEHRAAQTVRVQVGGDEAVAVPLAAYALLLEILGQMAQGKAVAIVPIIVNDDAASELLQLGQEVNT